MGNVIQLPGSARVPVQKPPRQHGPYASRSVVPQAKMIALRNKREWDAGLARVQDGKQAVELLEWMLEEARRGKLRDICTVFLHDDQGELRALTGAYRRDPGYIDQAMLALTGSGEPLAET